jgi:hypothetical protein
VDRVGEAFGLDRGLSFPLFREEIVPGGDDFDREGEVAQGEKILVPCDEEVRLCRKAALKEHVVRRVAANLQALFRIYQTGVCDDGRDPCDKVPELPVFDLSPFRQGGGDFPVFLQQVGGNEDMAFDHGFPNGFPRVATECEGRNQDAGVDDEFISLPRRFFSGSS